LIIGGVWYWNHFQAESKRKAEEEIKRWERRTNQIMEREQLRAAEQYMKDMHNRSNQFMEAVRQAQEARRMMEERRGMFRK
jgi:hypothetical protein